MSNHTVVRSKESLPKPWCPCAFILITSFITNTTVSSPSSSLCSTSEMYVTDFWLGVDYIIIACWQDLLILALYVEWAWCWSMSFRNGQFEVPIQAFLFGLWRFCLHYEAISIRYMSLEVLFIRQHQALAEAIASLGQTKLCKAHNYLLNDTRVWFLWTEEATGHRPSQLLLVVQAFLWMLCVVLLLMYFSLFFPSQILMSPSCNPSPHKQGGKILILNLFLDFFCDIWLGILTVKLPPLQTILIISRPGLSSRMNEEEIVK